MWQKLGRIFDPENHKNEWLHSHAMLPFTENLGDSLFRIYFSGRDAENRAHIGTFVFDLTSPFESPNVSPSPILSPGFEGLFDDRGLTMGSIVYNNNKSYLYYGGWNLLKTVPFTVSIGCAIAERGTCDFTKASLAPVIGRTATDPYMNGAPSIIIKDGVWHCWHSSGVRWEKIGDEYKHYYHIRYAHSEDGINWITTGHVCIDFANEFEYAFARPQVLETETGYEMWYCYRATPTCDAYVLGYATSQDGLNWVRADDQAGLAPSEEGWDSEMIAYPHVFTHKGKRYMLYNGNGYGRSGIGLAIER